MLTNGNVLDLLYRQISPERILEVLESNLSEDIAAFLRLKNPNAETGEYFEIQNQPMVDKNYFLDYADTTLGGYSEDEHRLLFDQIGQHRDYWRSKGIDKSCGFLIPLIEFADEYLKIIVDEPVCKQGKVLDWREAYLRLGQDLFVTAFLAWKDHNNNTYRKDFTWPVILRVDHQEIDEILQKGFAENHNHLAGGTQSYQVTWCRMMNYPGQIRTELKSFHSSKLFGKFSRGEKQSKLDMFDMLELAALVRTILFRALNRYEFSNNYGNGNLGTNCPFDGRQAFLEEYLEAFSFLNGLEDTVDCLRNAYGIRLQVLGNDDYCLDYAMEDIYLRAGKNKNIRIVIGERAFLYQCMRACLDGNRFSVFEKELFYLYIVLQSNFRSEMIQTNEQTGFMNFKNYQDRKDDAWGETPYFSDAINMALNNRLYNEHVTLLEGRMVPKDQVKKNIKKTYDYDLAKRFSDCDADEVWDKNNYDFDPDLDLELFKNAPWFYVFHYFKVPDSRKLEPKKFTLPECRHAKHRKMVMDQTIGFVSALRESPYFRSRVRGIDSASDEVFCRPEVFATGFRYIDAVQEKWNASDNGLLPYSPIRISKTYHAGEDFLDLAGGMRAIDEAIRFLHMGPHSRIGHALALGVDPFIHYKTKHNEIITTKQERLDDLVWILCRGKELGVLIERSLEAALKSEADQLLREIYLEAITKNKWDSNLNTYWKSMKLRCDDPSVYSSGEFKAPGFSVDEVSAYLIDTENKELEVYRQDPHISGLYSCYHFDVNAGLRGKQTYTIRVTKPYIELMRQIQDAMMKFVVSENLFIETNPSSNVLIGTFKDYSKHPVFRFNNRKLYSKSDYRRRGNTQLSVCVNTDDLGVFDTNLVFEYELLYEALQKRREECEPVQRYQEYSNACENQGPVNSVWNYPSGTDGISEYSDQDILEYLDDLREMGIRAVFPPNI